MQHAGKKQENGKPGIENREFRTGKLNGGSIGPFSILDSRFSIFFPCEQ